MNDIFENKYTMYEAVSTLLTDNAAKTAAIPAFTTAHNNFKNTMSEINAKNQLKDTVTSGKTNLKNQNKNLVVESAVAIAGALHALGSANNDPVIKAQADIRKTDLKKLRDTNLVDKATSIKDLANANAAGLVDYGIDAAQITELENFITAYAASIGGKDSSYSTKFGAGQVMETLFDDADLILKEQLDRMMEQFKDKDEQFYLEYKNARVIRDLGHRFDDPADNPTPPNP